MDNLLEFFARLHPLIVHLPVAILPLAGLLTFLTRQGKNAHFEAILPSIWILGAFTTSIACLSGLLIQQPVGLHKWMGLICAFGAILYSIFLLKGKRNFKGLQFFSGFIGILTLITGYFGATITYGERFLTKKQDASFTTFEKEIKNFSANDIPSEPIAPADAKTLEDLRKAGFLVLPVGKESNYLSVNAINVTQFSDEKTRLLTPLNNHIVWLKLGDQPLSDSSLQWVGLMKNLSRLHLERTKITDTGLQYLQSLSRLYLLNLTETAITKDGVLQLTTLKQLKYLYLFKTKVNTLDWQSFKNSFPTTNLDTGGYIVPTWVSDTVLLKDTKPKK
jgi:hypothetical protein